MARLVRVSPVGVPQHIVQRGNNRQVCYGGEEDMKAYLNWLKVKTKTSIDKKSYKHEFISTFICFCQRVIYSNILIVEFI